MESDAYDYYYYRNKYLDPNDTFNPILWRVNKAIKARALDPNAAIPKLGKEFQIQYNTPDAFKESLMFTAARLQDHFQIKKGMVYQSILISLLMLFLYSGGKGKEEKVRTSE